MGILRVLLYDHVEVLDGLFVVLDHLVGLCSLMHEPDVRRNSIDASAVGEDGLLELLEAAVS